MQFSIISLEFCYFFEAGAGILQLFLKLVLEIELTVIVLENDSCFC